MKKLLVLLSVLSLKSFAYGDFSSSQHVGSCELEKPTTINGTNVDIYLESGNLFGGTGYIDAQQALGKEISITFSLGMWKYLEEIERLNVYSKNNTTKISGRTGYRGNGEFNATIDGKTTLCTIFHDEQSIVKQNVLKPTAEFITSLTINEIEQDGEFTIARGTEVYHGRSFPMEIRLGQQTFNSSMNRKLDKVNLELLNFIKENGLPVFVGGAEFVSKCYPKQCGQRVLFHYVNLSGLELNLDLLENK